MNKTKAVINKIWLIVCLMSAYLDIGDTARRIIYGWDFEPNFIRSSYYLVTLLLAFMLRDERW